MAYEETDESRMYESAGGMPEIKKKIEEIKLKRRTVMANGERQIPVGRSREVADVFSRVDELLELMALQMDRTNQILEQIYGKPAVVVSPGKDGEIVIDRKSELIDFPKSLNWYWEPVQFTNQPIAANTPSFPIYDMTDKAGYIYSLWIMADNPLLRWNIHYEAIGRYDLEASFFTQNTTGAPNSIGGGRILRYDVVNNVYVMELTPGLLGFPGIPFRGKLRAYLINPTAVQITFSLLGSLIIVR